MNDVLPIETLNPVAESPPPETLVVEPPSVEVPATDDLFTGDPVIELPDEETTATQLQERRRDWAIRIREERRLPGSLRERLAAAVEEASHLSDAADEPRLTVLQVANIFAEAVPSLLMLETPHAAVADHPSGDAFFCGGRVSDADAARIAKEQLARSGFATL